MFQYYNEIRSVRFFIMLCLLMCSVSAHGKEKLITVRLGAIEGFSMLDTTSSERYKSSFEAAVNYAIGENEQKLNSCGYRLETGVEYFNSSDLISTQKSIEELKEFKPWLIIGPTRSNHFIMMTKNIKKIPLISLDADAQSIADMSSPVFLMSQPVKRIASTAVKVVKKEHLGKKYGVFLDSGCVQCHDFEKFFEEGSQQYFQKIFVLSESGDSPNLEALFSKIEKSNIDFLLLPDYSKFSGHVMSAVHKKFPKIAFVGGSGWGQTTWGFIPAYHLSNDTLAFCVRPGSSDTKMQNLYKVYSLNKQWKEGVICPPQLSYSVIESIRKMTTALCQARPQNRDDFVSFLMKQPKNYFATISTIGVYKLRDEQMQFEYSSKDLK